MILGYWNDPITSEEAAQRPWERLAAYDAGLRKTYGPIIVGVDECGRGAMTGPIAAGAVLLHAKDARRLEGVNDSKKMSEAAREKLAEIIIEIAAGWSVQYIWPEEIDSKGLSWANKEVMCRAAMRAWHMAGMRPDLYAVDQTTQFDRMGCHLHMIPKGDGTSLSIAAASVIAKVSRDRLMTAMDAKYPGYELAASKGYINASTTAAVNKLGIVRGLHRFSYKNLKDVAERKISMAGAANG